MTFQRARSEEQREQRRQAVLDAADGMLAQMPVADVTLTELARRAGLAKSNVLRYFDSREAVLLELLARAQREWVADLRERVARAGRRGGAALRADRLAAAVAASLAERPVLCDLMAAQAAVLERNVSVEVAARYKEASLAVLGEIADVVVQAVPEVGADDAFRFAAGTVLVAGAAWAHARPSPAMVAAYEQRPELAVLRLDLEDVVRQMLEIFLAGLLARRS